MTRRLLFSLAVLLISAPTGAHDVITTPITFSREISRLLYARCISCHRNGGGAFSLMTYAEARPWAKAIKEEVLERRMPPWGAVKGFGEFRDDQGLTQEQIELIADWVEGGAPEGDTALLPKEPDFSVHKPEPAVAETTVRETLVLRAAIKLTGIRPTGVPTGASLMVTAVLPDGSTEPLLWLYNFNPKFAHRYYYAVSSRLPAGTRIEVSPPAGAVALLTPKT